MSSAAPALAFTGERFLPEVEGAIALEHMHRYHLVEQLCSDRDVLDIASGEGYGSALIARHARNVVGVDISREAVTHAATRYASVTNLRFMVGDCADIPLPDASVDVVVSFETIEHHARHAEMMREIRRVLRPGGVLAISSPDKYYYSIEPGYRNEYHVKELYRFEFEQLLASTFARHALYGQRVCYGSAVLPETGEAAAFRDWMVRPGRVESVRGLARPVYWIALASDGPLPVLEGSLFEQSIDEHDTIRELRRALAERTGQVQGLTDAVAARDAEVAELRGKVAGLSHAVEVRDSEVAELRGKVAGLTHAFEARDVEAQALRGSVAGLQRAVGARETERDEWQGKAAGLLHAVESGRTLIAELEGKLAGMTRAFEIRDGETAALQTRVAEFEHAVADHVAERAALRDRVEALAHDLDAARARTGELESGLAVLTRQLAERENALAAARDEADRVERELADSRATTADLKNSVDVLGNALKNEHALRLEIATSLAERAADLGRQVHERDQLLALHRQTLGDVTEQASQMHGQLARILRSRSWKLTSALRAIQRVLRSGGPLTIEDDEVKAYKGIPEPRLRQPLPLPSPPAVADLAALPAASPEPEPSVRPGVPRILLVSYYCPSRSHAGGLRVLDLYMLIRERRPDVELHLYTHRRDTIDWSIGDVETMFDRVFWSPVEALTADGFRALAGPQARYDVIDLQFHPAAVDMEGFRRLGGKILFTPMELLSRFLFLQLAPSAGLKATERLRVVARSIRPIAEELLYSYRADEVVCVSRTDAAFLRAITGLRRVRTLETGVSQLEFRDMLGAGAELPDVATKARRVLYVAYFGSQTNVDALRWYLEKVHPLVLKAVPDYQLQVVGRGDLAPFERHRGPSVDLVGEVDRLAPYISAARVGIAPALGGSGFRGKVNQYALFGVPTVASYIAAKGLAYLDGTNIMVADDPAAFADRCAALLTDDQLNRSVGRRALELCRDRYTWNSRWQTVASLYNLDRPPA